LKIRTLRYFSREAVRGICRNRLMSLAAIGTITMALLLFGGFYLVTSNLQYWGQRAKSQIEMRAFLGKTAPGRQEMERRLSSIPGVKEVKFIPKEEGARILSEMLGQPGLFSQGENPLPDGFNIYPASGADVEAIAAKIQRISGVEEVVYGQNFVRLLNLFVRLIWIVGLILISLTVFAVLYIVINTIQLTVYARRQEIEIMKLVGATDSFVRWPFLLEGVYLGIIGALISIFLLLEGYTILYGKAKSFTRILPVLSGFEVTTDLIVFLLAMGIFFGVLGSSLSVRRYLKV
jgi:cell division transport system permease protein